MTLLIDLRRELRLAMGFTGVISSLGADCVPFLRSTRDSTRICECR